MGDWGIEPWSNDGAADWFADLFHETQLASQIEKALNLDVYERSMEIRAAAYLVRLLARTYIYPPDDIDRHRALAADRLKAVLDTGVFSDSEAFTKAVQSEIEELRRPA